MADSKHRIDSLPLYLVIYLLLMALLVTTVAAASLDLGRWNVVVALLIAVIKALLVVLFFMHVRHSSHLTWLFAAAAFVWLGLLLSLTMTDYASRNPKLPNSQAQIAADNPLTGASSAPQK